MAICFYRQISTVCQIDVQPTVLSLMLLKQKLSVSAEKRNMLADPLSMSFLILEFCI
jgi:hypothetical protein